MKNFLSRKALVIISSIAVLVAGIYYFTQGNKKHNSNFIDPAFGEYIASYTAGVVSSNSTIRIILAKDAVDSSSIGQESASKLFSFSPSIKGSATWLDKRTIEFKPAERLTSGQVYEVGFKLSKLFTVADALSVFEYSFQVIPQNFELTIENIKPYVKTELTRQKVEGLITTADFAGNESVEKILAASQDEKSLKVNWNHSQDGKQHNFTVEEVTRGESENKVKLAINGESLGINSEEEREVIIPALGDFKIVNAKVVQNPNQYVVLQFSDPLKERQELNGLVTVAGGDLTLDFEIHDNEIWVYPPVRQTGTKTVYVEAGLRNINDFRMKEQTSVDVLFEQLKPEVRFVGKGTILPSTDGLILPFEAVNLRSVDVSIKKVFENNILQFLQVNNISGNYEMHRVGKNILKKTIRLDNTGITDVGKWNRYTLDLATLINTEPGAIYQITLKFKKSYAAYVCDGGDSNDELSTIESEDLEEENNYNYGSHYYYEDEEYYYGEGYNWEERDDPCKPSYYTSSHNITRNVLASDLGITTKRGTDGNTLIIVSDLKTTAPISGVTVELYDFQQQLLGTVSTGSDGIGVIHTKETPFSIIAKKEMQRGYLRLVDGESLSLSGFDVSGETIAKGLKGFIYGERGVWRPGDSLYLSFILEDKNKMLPATHPVVFELQNPRGIVTNRQVKSSAENGFYRFVSSTSPDAPTGNWNAHIKVGGTDFNQQIKIETVKPNRLKINLDFGTDRITSPTITGNLDVKWLHGATGKNLKARFEATIIKGNTSFKKFSDYTFEEPSYSFNIEKQTVFEGMTDSEGKASFTSTLPQSSHYPGFMTAIFNGKVFEESGNFSIDRFSLPYYPFASYVGLKLPKGEKYTGMLYTDSTQKVDVVFLDADGNPVPRNGVEINIYRLERYWWWDNSNDNIANYIERDNSRLISSTTINAPAGKGNSSFKIPEADWGTYYMRICDPVSGHCTGQKFYIDHPGYFGRNSREEKGGATRLSFSADKSTYNVGDKINLNIPGSGEGRALISIENGSKVVSKMWVETKKGENNISIDATADMTPNVFVNVSLIQPHSQTVNDLPIRLYGIIPIGVEDPATHLEPIISMPEEIEPGQEVSIKVSEKSKRKMTFTLAMVDEGLLDITRFKTPEPWKRFYAREALGVKTWDLYDDVMGAFGSRVERLLAIGGDEGLKAKDDDPRANRFKPVVKFFGPMTLNAGDQKEIKFVMPQYIGSVKTMVVAGNEGAYGNADKAVPVRKKLMVLATLPRVLGPEEHLRLPITMFTQDKKIKSVKVDVKTSGPLSLPNGGSRSVEIPPSGDLTIDFDLDVKSEIGIGKVLVTATSGSIQSTDEIEIEVRNPNPPVSQSTDIFLEAGKNWNASIMPLGMAGTNSAMLEVSSIPPINLGYRLSHLMEYPHGCIEQTTSAAFPQLYLDVVKTLTDAEKTRTKNNITKAIEHLKMFITRDGGFAYWPGGEDSDSWGSTYAGHFLLEAESKGYYVPADMIKRWKKYQRNKALEWRKNDNKYYYNTELIQAYRLYTLAIAGSAELGAMNRLRETNDISLQSKWMLAAAYLKAGQPEAAKKLVTNLSTSVKNYQEMAYTYGSDLRDKAIILETLTLLNEKTKGFEVLKEISKSLSNQSYWMSTQTIAFCLKAVGLFVSTEKRGELKFAYNYAGKLVNASTDLPIAQIPLQIKGAQKNSVAVTNSSNGSLFVRLILTGTPARGEEQAEENNLNISVSYVDMKNNTINPSRLEQGTQFIATVTVKNPGLRSTYENLALTQIFPSGWEINNLRLTNDENTLKSDRGNYQDIRDDRVYTYFNLSNGETRTFKILLTASYAGNYYLPAVTCEAMYDHSVYARTSGQVVDVVKGRVTP
ncbi:MAG TPA: hypothetical protein DGG95_11285 [Cytophagales bacterium]|jgi:alpha-2-macroglobulin|nr:hypothetical protein [Cytophagales bacterium]